MVIPSILFHGNTRSESRADTCSHKDRQKITTELKLRSSGNTLGRTKISSTPRPKMKITPNESSTPFSRLQQNHLKVARLKDTREYSKINHKLFVCQLFPAALLHSYLIAIILQPRKKCFARGVFSFPTKKWKKEETETRLVKNITIHIHLNNHQFQGLKSKKIYLFKYKNYRYL